MLSIAYGADQADDDVQLHYPEVCYPAQGFRVTNNRTAVLNLPEGDVRVRRLDTQFGDSRFEPVTYWTIVGDQQSLSGWDRKISEIRHGLRGRNRRRPVVQRVVDRSQLRRGLRCAERIHS